MPKHVAIQPGRLYPQPDYTIQVDKEGKWTVTQVHLCHRNSAVALMPRPGAAHPEVPFVAVSQAAVKVTEGDLAEITCTYTGAEAKDEEDEKANAVYTMGLSLSEEPILTHPRYAALDPGEREALQMILAGKEKDDQGNKLRDKVVSERGLEVRSCRVLAVNDDLQVVVLDSGYAEGIRRGSHWQIARDDEVAVRLRVIDVRADISAAVVVDGRFGDVGPGSEVAPARK